MRRTIVLTLLAFELLVSSAILASARPLFAQAGRLGGIAHMGRAMHIAERVAWAARAFTHRHLPG